MAAHSPITELMQGSPYQGYAYSYPHKHAYHKLPTPLDLNSVWSHEKKDALFLYLHIPFCEMRCGFCNLFTESHSRAGIKPDVEDSYLTGLERQANVSASILNGATFARGAIGGGTPTYLSPTGLLRLLKVFRSMGPGAIPISVETSPFSATNERLSILKEFGVTRISIGIQSFIENEVRASGRAQSNAEVDLALRSIRNVDFPELNLDFIYGLPGQTESSWRNSLLRALEWKPEELYLYPLYVRPLTGLARKDENRGSESWNVMRKNCYRLGRDLLLAHGYQQYSMRHFRRKDLFESQTDYACQQDGMVGLGCGARSYTQRLHYSTAYAVGRKNIASIIAEYVKCASVDFETVDYGFQLDGDEQRRRVVIKSLLHREGLDQVNYRALFTSDVFSDIPALNDLVDAKLVHYNGNKIQLTETGMEYSDVIGPWLGSARVGEHVNSFLLQ